MTRDVVDAVKAHHAAVLLEFMKSEGLTQERLAKDLGVSQGNVGHWVRGRQRVSPEKARELEKKYLGRIKARDFYPELFCT